MRAKSLSDLLKSGDRIAVSNITGREASKVSVDSQRFCGNIIGGWALGKSGKTLDVSGKDPIPVFGTVDELMQYFPREKRPNKVIIYSPPAAVYAEVKEVLDHSEGGIETIYVITEHVSVEVMSKVAQMCKQANIDLVGGNSLGMINTCDGVRVGAVGGDDPADSFTPGSAAIFSNSGNMVNTMASYLLSAGIGTSYGVSTGKDSLILTSFGDLLELARDDEKTKMIISYLEPGGLYEKTAVEMMKKTNYPKPVIAYITGGVLGHMDLSLGHAGAVVEGSGTSAEDKTELFDAYFGMPPFDPEKKYEKNAKLKKCLSRGIRITSLHHLAAAAALVSRVLDIERDTTPSKPLKLNPWFLDYQHQEMEKHLPRKLILHKGVIPKPYDKQAKLLSKETLGATLSRRNMRNASHASSNDGKITRLYGYSLEEEMRRGSFVGSLFLSWLGERPREFEADLLEKCLIASLSNGPGTISAQGVKLSTSAGNSPNTAMIATLASIGDVHGGNGKRAIKYLLDVFRDADLKDPFSVKHGLDLDAIAEQEAERFAHERSNAKEAGTDYRRIPCLGHPVFRNDPVNYDPRERVIAAYLKETDLCNVFLDFYHNLAGRLKKIGVARNVWAVNLDGAIASIVLGVCWEGLRAKRVSVKRISDIAFMLFALGRVGGAGGEYLDHQDTGSPMDMRVPVLECISLTRPKD